MFRRLKPSQVAVDVLIAVATFVVSYWLTGDRTAAGLLSLGLAIALGFRRFSPALALAISWFAALAQMYLVAESPNVFDLAIVAVVYATAAYGSRIVRLLGFASIFLGAILGASFLAGGNSFAVALRLNPTTFAAFAQVILQYGFYFAMLVILLGLPWTAGNLVRTRSLARQSRVAQASAERETEIAEQGVIVEQERNRIARDMHDIVAHSLAVVIAQADGARYARESDPAAVDGALTVISSTARDALADVRLLLGQLRDAQPTGPQPALADLDRLLEQLRASSLTIVFGSEGESFACGTAQQLAVYRIAQEALTNALRHGDISREVTMHFAWSAEQLEVSITNQMNSAPVTGELRMGHGLAGMRERAALVGGSLATEVTDRTFVVRAVIPAVSVPVSAVPE